MIDEQARDRKVADDVYRRHVMPLEKEHSGEYVVVTPEGRIILGKSLVEVVQQAHHASSRGNFIFKIGDKAVGRLG